MSVLFETLWIRNVLHALVPTLISGCQTAVSLAERWLCYTYAVTQRSALWVTLS